MTGIGDHVGRGEWWRPSWEEDLVGSGRLPWLVDEFHQSLLIIVLQLQAAGQRVSPTATLPAPILIKVDNTHYTHPLACSIGLQHSHIAIASFQEGHSQTETHTHYFLLHFGIKKNSKCEKNLNVRLCKYFTINDV